MLPVTEQVWRHLLVAASDERRRWPSLAALSQELGMKTSTVHAALRYPCEVGAITRYPRGGFGLVDPGKLQIIWAGRRRLSRDVVRKFQVAASAPATEAALLSGYPVMVGGFGAAIAALGRNVISDYSTVITYGDPVGFSEDPDGSTEVIVCESDPLLARYGRTTPMCQAWADLFVLGGWQASEFWHALLPGVPGA